MEKSFPEGGPNHDELAKEFNSEIKRRKDKWDIEDTLREIEGDDVTDEERGAREDFENREFTEEVKECLRVLARAITAGATNLGRSSIYDFSILDPREEEGRGKERIIQEAYHAASKLYDTGYCRLFRDRGDHAYLMLYLNNREAKFYESFIQ